MESKMNGIGVRFASFAALMAVVSFGWILTGRAASPTERGYPTDWSHRHLIFSRPASVEEEARVGRDPRYWQQYERRNIPRTLAGDESNPVSFGAFAAQQRPAIHRDWSEDMGSTATVGAVNYPAKFSFQITTANCGNATPPDYVVFNTGLLGSTGQASVVAYDNLYSGCTAPVPAVYWAYNTGGIVLTSPVISGDGTQVAFVQSNTAATQGSLVLLKFAPGGTVTSPTTLTAVATTAYRACTAPCMTTVPLLHGTTAVDDRTSSAFPDYDDDVIWVGGAAGWLFKFSGVFVGTPAEVTTGGFPVQLNAGASALDSPVYDSTSNNVFVGDLGGFLYQVTGAGAFKASGRVDHGTGLVSGPVVDSTTSKIYVFSSSDGSTSCTGGVPCAAVYQFAYGFNSGDIPTTKVVVGNSVAAPEPMYEGTFDNTYYNSTVGTGNLYVCGNTGGAPILYQIPITTGTMGTVVTGPTLASAATGCSSLTDFSNPNVTGHPDEWIFAGVQGSGSGNSCATGGCLMNFNVQPWQPSTAYDVGQQILDTHFQIQTARCPTAAICTTAGTSGTSVPAWSTTIGNTTTESTDLRWVNQGPQIAAHPAWTASHAYALHSAIIDSNGNVQVVTTAGTSKAAPHPTWATTVNTLTADGTVRWRNAGLPATVSLAADGGTSGIIIDNTVSVSTRAGASQVYFSTQGNQACGTTGTGGCAVQASQAALN
jgi:hypothetical protein